MGRHANNTRKWFHGKLWRTTAMVLAAAVVFSTTYALILPAITLDNDTAEEDAAIVLETATPEPTAVPTPEPTAVPEADPTEPPADPDPTATPEPEATTTPEPEATATPEPEATTTPEPEATTTPEPEATATPEPETTATPEPETVTEPEILYPEMTLKEKFGRLTVEAQVRADTLPAGTKLVLREIDDQLTIDVLNAKLVDGYTSVKMFDLSFELNGVKVAPNGDVHFSIKDDLIYNAETTVVLRADEEYEVREVEQKNEETYANEVTFELDKTGAFAVVGCGVVEHTEPTPEPTPEITPAPEATDDPEATPAPEATDDPEATPAPEATDDPENTPDPEATDDPENTPDPEATQEPEATPEATEEPEVVVDPNMPAMTLRANMGRSLVTVEANAGTFPSGTGLVLLPVQDESYTAAIADLLGVEEPEYRLIKLSYVHNYTTEDGDASEDVAPAQRVRVTIADDMITEADHVAVISFADNYAPSALTQKNDLAGENEIVVFTRYADVLAIVKVEDEIEAADEDEIIAAVEAAEAAANARPAQPFKDEIDGLIVEVDAPEGAFPANTRMELKMVETDQILSSVESALDEGTEIIKVKAVDITFYNEKGEEIQPECPIAVSIRDALVAENNGAQVVHVDADGNAEVMKQKDDTANNEVAFDAEHFSTYVVVISTRVITASGETYEINVTFGDDAQIPAGAELTAEEIPVDSEVYWDYYWRTAEAMGCESGLSHARFFDVKIKVGNEEIEPKAPVTTTIKYVDPVDTTLVGDPVKAIHFTEDGEVQVIDTKANDDSTEFTFTQASFSVTGTANSSIGEGEYVIYRQGDYSRYALSYNPANGHLGSVNGSESGGVVEYDSDNVKWTFTKVDGGYRISFVANNGKTRYLYASNDSTIATTENSNNASVWNYDLRTESLYTTRYYSYRYINYNNNTFGLSDYYGSAYIRLALVTAPEPLEITVHFVNESGEELKDPVTLPASTSTGVTAIRDIVDRIDNYTYHNTYLDSFNSSTDHGTQIVPELRGARGGKWEYQVYGQEAYTTINNATDIYVVYGSGYGGGSGSGHSGGGDTPEIGTPATDKHWDNNNDGTYDLSLSITGRGASGSESNGANVILILDTSNSMEKTVSGGGTRFSNAVKAAQDVATNLLALNANSPDPTKPLVEMCLVQFNWNVSTSGWYTEAGEESGGTYPQGSFNRLIASATRNSGTNWEGALQGAIAAANAHQDGDATYIIFLTDGNPSAYTGTNGGNGRYSSEASTSTTDPNTVYYRISDNYMHATDEARQIVQNGWNFYTIGMYGNVDVLKYLTNFAYTGRSDGNQQGHGGRYFPAAETQTLINALDNIASVIKNTLLLAGVSITDGVAADSTSASLAVMAGSLQGVRYTKSPGTDADGNATLGFTVTVNGNTPTFTFTDGGSSTGSLVDKTYKKISGSGSSVITEDATGQVYRTTYKGKTYEITPASYVNSQLDWDLGPLGTLEAGATYKVTFTIWPKQEAYDYVADLNNGLKDWNESTQQAVTDAAGNIRYWKNGSPYENIVKYSNGTFSVLTNTNQSVDYYIASTTENPDGTTTTTYEKGPTIDLPLPDPLVLTGSSFSVTKKWTDSLQPFSDDIPAVTLKLYEDGTLYNTYTFTPTQDAEGHAVWAPQEIFIAPGILTSRDPGGEAHTPVTLNGSTYYVVNKGHEYLLEEVNTDLHYEFHTVVYHPCLVNGVLQNLQFVVDGSGNIVPDSEVKIVGDVPLQTFEGENRLRGGINIVKKVMDQNDAIVDSDEVFTIKIDMTAPRDANNNIDWSNVEVYTDSSGAIVKPHVAWFYYMYLDDEGVEQRVNDPSSLDFLADLAQDPAVHDSGAWFYLEFKDDGTGTVTVPITDDYFIRFVNMATGTGYEVTETDTKGMQPTITYYQSDHKVHYNLPNDVAISNKILDRYVIVYKTDLGGEKALADAGFTLNGGSLTSGASGYTNVVKLPISTTPYNLVETAAPAGYNPMSAAAPVTVSADSVTWTQADANGDRPQTATKLTAEQITELKKDSAWNEAYTALGSPTDVYVIQIRDNAGTELPHTGGMGTMKFTMGGMVLIFTALAIGCGLRRKERRYE